MSVLWPTKNWITIHWWFLDPQFGNSNQKQFMCPWHVDFAVRENKSRIYMQAKCPEHTSVPIQTTLVWCLSQMWWEKHAWVQDTHALVAEGKLLSNGAFPNQWTWMKVPPGSEKSHVGLFNLINWEEGQQMMAGGEGNFSAIDPTYMATSGTCASCSYASVPWDCTTW